MELIEIAPFNLKKENEMKNVTKVTEKVLKHYPEKVPNQNDIRLRDTTAFNNFPFSLSSSRAQMLASALSQHYVISGSEPNTIVTGIEQELGKYTYNIKAEHNLSVIAIVDRYITSGYNGIKINPQTIVIYRTFDGSQNNKPLYGMMDITKISHNHPKFGFEFKPTEAAHKLRIGGNIAKGTILYDTPAKDELGNYGMGINLNTVYSSLEGTIEDSILISKDIVSKLATKTYIDTSISFGERDYPLNLYGDEHHYKIFPEIGEYVKPKNNGYAGLLMATREFNPELLPITFTRKATMEFDPITDQGLDSGGSGGRIVDIIVYRQSRNNSSSLAPEVLEQLNKYADAYKDFCERIVREYRKIMQETDGKAEFTDEFDYLIRHCMAIIGEPVTNSRGRNVPIQLVGNFNRKLDDWTILFKIEFEKTPLAGYKITNMSD